MTSRQGLGRLGEELARRHLQAKGYSILAANHRVGRYEIDLVAEKDGTLVFVEVRIRRGNSMGTPEESLTPLKRARMAAAAEAYLQTCQAYDREWRVDVVAVELDSRGRLMRVEVIENAIEA